MNDKLNTCKCDKCGYGFVVKQKEIKATEDGMKLIGEPVTVRAFMCPNCNKIYVVSVMTDTMIKQLKGTITKNERNQLKHKEKELRNIYMKKLYDSR